MKKIHTFESFQYNEEMKWSDVKKAAAGVALGAGLALGSPAKALPTSIATDTTSTVQQKSTPTDVEYIQVIQAPGKSEADIYEHIINVFSSLRQDKSVVQSFNYQKVDKGHLSGEMQLKVSPSSTRGYTDAEFDIYIKEGRYKIIIRNINFIHVGQQPMSAGETIDAKYRPMVGTAASQAVRRSLGGNLGGIGDVLGGIAAGAIQDIALKPARAKENFKLQSMKSKPRGISKENYDEYSEKVKKSADYFIGLFTNTNTNTDLDF